MKKVFFKLEKVNDEVAQLSFMINNVNIMEFIQNGEHKIVTWDYDELVDYFTQNLKYIMIEDSFPFNVEGNTAAELDNSVDLDADSLSNDEFIKQYELIYTWRQKHSWLHASGGAILPDVYFRRVKDKIEISWWTSNMYEGITFVNDEGFYYCELEEFEEAVKDFIQSYRKLHI